MNLRIDPGSTGDFRSKDEALTITEDYQRRLNDLLYLMYAEGRRALLVILHGIDASGKDGVVRHIFSGANPQGLRVHSFKRPSDEELRHDIFWRCHRVLPEAGYTAIFNRSYYEEVSTVQVHPELLARQFLPDEIRRDPRIFKKRYRQINDFEKMLCENGVLVVKFLLHISKAEQKERIKDRLADPTKNWKFSPEDIKERRHWARHMAVFKEMVRATSTPYAPWTIVPADKKWYRNYVVSKTLVDRLSQVKMRFPRVKGADRLKV